MIQQIFIMSSTTYAIVRFLTQDTSIKDHRNDLIRWFNNKHHYQPSKPKKIFIQTIYRFLIWPYWLAPVFIVAEYFIYNIHNPLWIIMPTIGIVYFLFDIQKD